MPEDATPPARADIPTVDTTSRAWVLVAILALMLMIAIEGTIVATAMPTIVGDLGGFDLFTWVFTSYILTQAVTIPIYGRLADLYGRKRILFVGMGFFLTASLLCGLAPNMIALVLFRALQGIGAGALQPVAMTMIADLYLPHERARTQAIVSSVWVAGAFMGPTAGAFLVAHAGWPMVFWVNLPFGIIATFMLAWWLVEQTRHQRRRIDYVGSVLIMVGGGLLMFVLVQATKLASSTIAVLGGIASVALVALFVYERQARDPMLPLALWRQRIIVGANIGNFIVGAVMMGITAFLPAYVQGVMGRSALTAGFMLTAMAGAWPTGSAIAGFVMLRTSYRTSATVGGISLVTGSLMLCFIAPDRATWFVTLAALLAGLGMGFANNSYLIAVQSNVDLGDRGVATSSILFLRMIGQSVGTAIFGGIVNAGLSRFTGDDIVDRMLTPALRDSLPLDELGPAMDAFAQALHNVYLISALLAFALLANVLCLPAGMSPIRPRKR